MRHFAIDELMFAMRRSDADQLEQAIRQASQYHEHGKVSDADRTEIGKLLPVAEQKLLDLTTKGWRGFCRKYNIGMRLKWYPADRHPTVTKIEDGKVIWPKGDKGVRVPGFLSISSSFGMFRFSMTIDDTWDVGITTGLVGRGMWRMLDIHICPSAPRLIHMGLIG